MQVSIPVFSDAGSTTGCAAMSSPLAFRLTGTPTPLSALADGIPMSSLHTIIRVEPCVRRLGCRLRYRVSLANCAAAGVSTPPSVAYTIPADYIPYDYG